MKNSNLIAYKLLDILYQYLVIKVLSIEIEENKVFIQINKNSFEPDNDLQTNLIDNVISYNCEYIDNLSPKGVEFSLSSTETCIYIELNF